MENHLTVSASLTTRERELSAIITAYNQVTERLKESHDRLHGEVRRLTRELARKNRELARRERLAALGQMAAGLAHEIRNPLGGIQLYATMLDRDVSDQPAQAELVQKIRTGVQSLESLVSDVLAFAGDAAPILEPVHVADLLAEAVELASAQALDRGVTVEAATMDTSVGLLCDRRQIVRALLNLLLNAIEVVDSVGWVRVWSAPVTGDERMYRLIVSDNGPGIETGQLDRIFNPFFTTKEVGTGLGLAIVHQICEAHNGSVRAQNRTEGGADFTLTIPVADVPATNKGTHAVGEIG